MQHDARDQAEGGVPAACDVLVEHALRKLRDKNRVVRWEDFQQTRELGEGGYGEVVEVRKLAGGALYAAKTFKKHGLGGERRLTHDVLAELQALLKARGPARSRAAPHARAAWAHTGPRYGAHATRGAQVKRSWQPCDVLDECWCPIVQVHGLFESPLGLLMEVYGVSLAEVLRGRVPPDKPFDNAARATVARHVASAMRFLHDRGVMHRDLKDANTLVDPGRGYRAKLVDFGTTRPVRAFLQGESAGTLHALAPEQLAAMCRHSLGREPDDDVDPRPVDAYAYGILLVALWDEGRAPDRHLPANEQQPGQRPLSELQHWRNQVTIVGLRPELPASMQQLYRDLAAACLSAAPDRRPTFSALCNTLKRKLESEQRDTQRPPTAPVQPAALARVVLTVRYAPRVAREAGVTVALSLRVEPRAEPLHVAEQGALDCAGIAQFTFPFLAAPGERLTVCLGRVWGEEASSKWVGGVKEDNDLLPLDGRLPTPPAGPFEHIITWMPAWAEAPQLPAAGLPTGLLVSVKRYVAVAPVQAEATGAPKTLLLGVLSLLMAAPASPRELRRLPTPLRGASPDIMISYREIETGLHGSNFAFRLQEALEERRYRVFCFASSVAAGATWMSPFTNGVQACRVFIAVCSPQYGDMGEAPWSAAELLHAARTSAASPRGEPHILPIWHHGEEYPPNTDSACVLANVPCVPDQELYGGKRARDMRYDDVWLLVLARLEQLGVHPQP
jgi:serine/threonine protein kinase